jgi:light-regulated signal transduction histidine kinase (bacteriophytochrome)
MRSRRNSDRGSALQNRIRSSLHFTAPRHCYATSVAFAPPLPSQFQARPHGYAMQSTIESCDLEPIHALGLIQGYGALVAFDRAGFVVARSTNATSLLGHLPGLGMKMTDAHFDETARDAIARVLGSPEQVAENAQCFGADNRRFDLVMHWSDDLLLA